MLAALLLSCSFLWSCSPGPAGAATRSTLATTSADVGVRALSAPRPGPWTALSSPNPGSSTDDLLGIACKSVSFCVAVGAYSDSPLLDDQSTLVERWNGRSWSLAASPSPGVDANLLDGVACTSATSCVAVGSYVNASDYQAPLAEKWNGKTWAVMSIAPPPGSRYGSYLSSIACPSATFCMAAGSYTYAADHENTLVEEWNGKDWAVVSSPSPESSNDLLSIACPSVTFCMAAGSYSSVSGELGALVEGWNGRSWTVVTSASSGSSNELLSVACPSATFCMAAGSYSSSSALQDQGTMVERWNGRSWALTPSPSPGDDGDALDGMSCTSPSFCAAVGSFVNGSSEADPLVEAWNGRAWAVESSPSPKAARDGSSLSSVSCSSASFCAAAGAYSYLTDHDRTLAERTD